MASFQEDGFTLLELLTVIAIIGVIAAVLAYNVSGWVQQTRLNEAASQVVADLRQARSRAQMTSQNSRFALCAVTTGSCATSSSSPSATYSMSWGATNSGGTGGVRTLPYGIRIAPATASTGGNYPNSITYTAPYAETTATGTVWQLINPTGRQIFIKVIGVTGKVSLSATVN